MITTREKKPSAPSPIQHKSSDSVKVFWLNQNELRDHLKYRAEQLAERFSEIDQVWLFGSLARGDATPGSDADLLLLLNESNVPFLDRSVRYQPDFCGVGVDVFAYTREEWSEMEEMKNAFLNEIRAQGICLFKRQRNREGTNE